MIVVRILLTNALSRTLDRIDIRPETIVLGVVMSLEERSRLVVIVQPPSDERNLPALGVDYPK